MIPAHRDVEQQEVATVCECRTSVTKVAAIPIDSWFIMIFLDLRLGCGQYPSSDA
jgi:hypothetical protein